MYSGKDLYVLLFACTFQLVYTNDYDNFDLNNLHPKINSSYGNYPTGRDVADSSRRASFIRDDFLRMLATYQLLYCPRQHMCTMRARQSAFKHASCCERKCACDADPSNDLAQCVDAPGSIETQCERPVFKRKYESKSSWGYAMKTRCPDNFKDTKIKNLCIFPDPEMHKVIDMSMRSNAYETAKFNISVHLPVTNINTNVTYRNQFCAYCHGEKLTALSPWKSKLKCEAMLQPVNPIVAMTSTGFLKEIYNASNCNLHFQPHHEHIASTHLCLEPEFSHCNLTGLWQTYNSTIERACRSYTSLYRKNYKNVFCFICNHGDESNTQMQCDNTLIIDFRNEHAEFIFGGSLYAELQFGIDQMMTECPISQIKDYVFDKCRHLQCPPTFMLSGMSCTAMYSLINKYRYHVTIMTELSTLDSICDVISCDNHEAVVEISKEIGYMIGKDILETKFRIYMCKHETPYVLMNVTSGIFISIHRFSFELKSDHNPVEWVNYLLNFNEKRLNLNFKGVSTPAKPTFVPSARFRMVSQSTMTDKLTQMIYTKVSSLDAIGGRCQTTVTPIEIYEDVLCPKFNISISEFDISFETDKNQICIQDVDVCIHNEAYDVTKESYLVCAEQYFSKVQALYRESINVKSTTDNNHLVLDTYVLIIISITLIPIFVAFVAYLASMRTGITNIQQCSDVCALLHIVTQFLMNVMILVILTFELNSFACLSVFFVTVFMTSCKPSLLLFSVLLSNYKQRQSLKRKHKQSHLRTRSLFLGFTFTCIVLPAVPPITSFFLFHTEAKLFLNKLCYVLDPDLVLYSTLLPVCVFLMLSILCLVDIFCKTPERTPDTKDATNPTTTNESMLVLSETSFYVFMMLLTYYNQNRFYFHACLALNAVESLVMMWFSVCKMKKNYTSEVDSPITHPTNENLTARHVSGTNESAKTISSPEPEETSFQQSSGELAPKEEISEPEVILQTENPTQNKTTETSFQETCAELAPKEAIPGLEVDLQPVNFTQNKNTETSDKDTYAELAPKEAISETVVDLQAENYTLNQETESDPDDDLCKTIDIPEVLPKDNESPDLSTKSHTLQTIKTTV